jgi:hypothetical protein
VSKPVNAEPGALVRSLSTSDRRRSLIVVYVEVYFGWSIPHEAPAGGAIEL